MNVMSAQYCLDHSVYDGAVTDSAEFCAGLPDLDGNGLTDESKDACQGDSG